MDIKIVDTMGEEVKPREGSPPEQIESEVGDNLQKKSIASLFDISDADMGRYEDKISDLLEWAKTKTEDHSQEGLKWAIRDLELKLNTPSIGEKMIDYMHRFAYLDMEESKIKEEKGKFM